MRPTETPRRRPLAAVASTVVTVAALCTACSASGGGPAASMSGGGPAATVSASRTESPVQACSRQVVYWVGESLRLAPDQGFDYQHMGLSGRTYEVVRAVTAEARAAGRSDAEWVGQRARVACERAVRASPDATSTAGGWP